MTLSQQIHTIAQAPLVNVPTTGASLTTLAFAFLEKIHGPMATIGVCLGAAWVALQIFLAVEKRWFRKDK